MARIRVSPRRGAADAAAVLGQPNRHQHRCSQQFFMCRNPTPLIARGRLRHCGRNAAPSRCGRGWPQRQGNLAARASDLTMAVLSFIAVKTAGDPHAPPSGICGR